MIPLRAWTGCCAGVAVLAGLAVIFPRPATPASAAFCSIGVSPFHRWPASTYVFGSFEDHVVQASGGEIASSGLGGHMANPPPDGSIWGQHFLIAAAGGSDAVTVYRPLAREPQRVVVVIWDYDAGCETTAYGGPLPMGIPNEQALIVGRLREPEHWVGGIPTIDTFWGGGLIYPITALVTGRENAEWAAQQWPPIPWERTEDLTAEDALELMRLLPEPCQDVWDPVGFAARMLVVRIAYLDDSRWPLPWVLDDMEERPNQTWRRSGCLADPRAVP